MMRYVKHLNSDWFNDLISDYITALEEIYNKFRYLHGSIAPFKETITLTPVTVGDKEFPFPLAAKLYSIYTWLIGEGELPKDIEDILGEIYHLVWFNPFIDYSEPLPEDMISERWTGPMGSYTGQFYRFAKTALAIEKGDSINATDLAILLNVTPMAISKQIKEKRIQAIKLKNEWIIESSEARRWISEKINPKNNAKEIFPKEEERKMGIFDGARSYGIIIESEKSETEDESSKIPHILTDSHLTEEELEEKGLGW